MTAASSPASNSSLTAAWRKFNLRRPWLSGAARQDPSKWLLCGEPTSRELKRTPGFGPQRREVYSFPRPMPSWYEKRVRSYEQMRFDQEPKRRTLPFAWGVEHIGGDPADANPRAFFDRYIVDAIAHSDDWYSIAPANDYALADGVLTFTSAIVSPWAANNRVHAQFFPAQKKGPAVVVLAQWNARWEEQQ